VCVVAPHDGKSLESSVANAVTAATQLDSDVHVVVGGDANVADIAAQAASLQGVSKVLVAESPALEHGLAEAHAQLLEQVQKANGYSHILGPASTYCKNILPRFAVALDVQPIADVTAIQDANTFVRPVYAGNAFNTVKSSDSVKVMTVRSTSFEGAVEGNSAPVESVAFAGNTQGVEWVQDALSESDRPELASAKTVVSGGRGLGGKEEFGIIEDLADSLGAAVGASRAAVDAGFAANDMQVGQTGKVVAPDLYVAVGISGAIQHLAGMKDSKTIVAVNKDPEAPIFQVADYGLVADLFEAVPELTKALTK
jgi:electron transfer flavoprotein alpha subunit